MAKIAVIRGAALAAMMALPAQADVAQVTDGVIAPAYDALAQAAAALDTAAQADCSAQALRPGFHALWDAWARVDFLRLGPVEDQGRALAMHYWPDAKGSGRRAQQALIDADAPAIDDPAAFGGLSVALRGLAGLERLIYPSDLQGGEDVLCRMRRATTADLAAMTAAIARDWPAHAAALRDPGGPGNTAYLTLDEARQALFTQIMTGLEYQADTRLARPMGTFDRPRPERAESLASGRGMRNVVAALGGLRDAALALAAPGTAPATEAAFDHAIAMAEAAGAGALAELDDPQARLKVEIAQQAIRAARDAVETEIGGAMGLTVGFNAKDGD